MTSSLVGSEMCIRDSFNVLEHGVTGLQWEDILHLVELLDILVLTLTGDPVSYTHLTLPTICSV
eukprot:4898206-Prorocentrum_lima.AAC.1